MTPIQLTPKLLAVMVPEGATQIRIGKASGNLHFYLGFAWWIELPPGQYEIVGMSNEIGEDVAKTMVEAVTIVNHRNKNNGVFNAGFENYEYKSGLCFTALESLATLLSSKGITGNCLIIKID